MARVAKGEIWSKFNMRSKLDVCLYFNSFSLGAILVMVDMQHGQQHAKASPKFVGDQFLVKVSIFNSTAMSVISGISGNGWYQRWMKTC